MLDAHVYLMLGSVTKANREVRPNEKLLIVSYRITYINVHVSKQYKP